MLVCDLDDRGALVHGARHVVARSGELRASAEEGAGVAGDVYLYTPTGVTIDSIRKALGYAPAPYSLLDAGALSCQLPRIPSPWPFGIAGSARIPMRNGSRDGVSDLLTGMRQGGWGEAKTLAFGQCCGGTGKSTGKQ